MKNKIEALEKEIERQSKELAELKVLANKEEEKWNVGDYAIVNENNYPNGSNNEILKKGDLFIVKKCDEKPFDYQEYVWLVPGANGGIVSKFCRKATLEEIEKHLIKEAEKKGFVKGAKVSLVRGKKFGYKGSNILRDIIDGISGHIVEIESLILKNNTILFETYGRHNIIVEMDGITIAPSHPIIEIGSRKVEFKDNHIKVGCKDIYSDSILRLNASIQQWNDKTDGIPIQSIKIQGADIGIEKIHEIAKHYSK